MSSEEEDEFPVLAEDQQMPRQTPGEVGEALTAKLPKGISGDLLTEEELADHLVRAAGFNLQTGPRTELLILPVVGNNTMNGLVGKSMDCKQLFDLFQSGPMKQCEEVLVIVRGEGNTVLIPDCSNTESVPFRVSSRSGTPKAREFNSGQAIEVSKTFDCESFQQKLTKHYMAKVNFFVIRCVLPYTTPQNAVKNATFAASSLYASHTGFLGAGMSVRE